MWRDKIKIIVVGVPDGDRAENTGLQMLTTLEPEVSLTIITKNDESVDLSGAFDVEAGNGDIIKLLRQLLENQRAVGADTILIVCDQDEVLAEFEQEADVVCADVDTFKRGLNAYFDGGLPSFLEEVGVE